MPKITSSAKILLQCPVRPQTLSTLLVLAFISACSPNTLPTQMSAPVSAASGVGKQNDGQFSIDEYLSSFVDFFNPESPTRKQITSKLGQPIDAKESREKNLHNPSLTDVYETMIYKDLEITLFKSGSDSIIVTAMNITGPAHALKGGLKVGDRTSDMTALLGESTEQSQVNGSDVDHYCDSFTGQTCLMFFSSNDVIHKISYQSYLD